MGDILEFTPRSNTSPEVRAQLALIAAGAAHSKSEARRLIAHKAPAALLALSIEQAKDGQVGPDAITSAGPVDYKIVAPPAERPRLSRDEAIQRIRKGLQARSGKAWSVSGGRGTGWGWIRVEAQPRRRVCDDGAHVPARRDEDQVIPTCQHSAAEKPCGGYLSREDAAELATLLGKDRIHSQGESIPASSAYYTEYVDRAEGREPSVIGEPYWD